MDLPLNSTNGSVTPNGKNGPDAQSELSRVVVPINVIDLTEELMERPQVIDLTKPVTISSLKVIDLTDEIFDMPSPIVVDCPTESFGRKQIVVTENHVRGVDLTKNPTNISSETVQLPVATVEMEPNETVVEMTSATSSSEVTLPSAEAEVTFDSLSLYHLTADELERSLPRTIHLPGATDSKDIDHLNEQLRTLLNEISILENSDVDFSSGCDSQSNFILIDEHKQTACQIYKRIMEITGKTETMARARERTCLDATTSFKYKEFNRKLERMVEKNERLPDICDVLECLERCNRKYKYQLSEEDCIDIGMWNFPSYIFVLQTLCTISSI